jgi:hypothetical protein
MSLAAKLPYDHPYAGGYPGLSSQALPTDADALDYLSRMATADGAGVETGVAIAVDEFISATKSSGVWDSIRASCILAGARTLAGALVPLKNEGPELWAEQTPTINNADGSAAEWDAATLTMSNTSPTTSIIRPRFDFYVGLEDGKQYRISGRLSGDLASIRNSVFRMGNTGSSVDIDPSTGLFDSTGTASGGLLPLLFTFDGSLGPFSVTIESISIREVIAAPTNVADGFVEGDYSRTSGLTGDGATTYLDSGRANDDETQNDKHIAVFTTQHHTRDATRCDIGCGAGNVGDSQLLTTATTRFYRANFTGAVSSVADTATSDGFWGVTRSSSSNVVGRYASTSVTLSDPSSSPTVGAIFVFSREAASYSDATIAFYSIGTSLGTDPAVGLADLDTAVTNLINRLKFAILVGENPSGLDPDTIDYIVRGYEAGGSLE